MGFWEALGPQTAAATVEMHAGHHGECHNIAPIRPGVLRVHPGRHGLRRQNDEVTNPWMLPAAWMLPLPARILCIGSNILETIGRLGIYSRELLW